MREAHMNKTEPRVIVAIDDIEILPVIEGINPDQCAVKVGKNLFTTIGPSLVRRLQNHNFNVFLDLKYHDIPDTVADAVEAAADMGVWMVNVHALGGRRMMEAARERLDMRNHKNPPKLIAVTVLTSMLDEDLHEMGIMHTPESLVWSLAGVAYRAGMDGVVCSPNELHSLRYRTDMDNNFLTVVPGVRPEGSAVNDQKRFATPTQAIRDDASFLVVGRPITQAADPEQVLHDINVEILNALEFKIE